MNSAIEIETAAQNLFNETHNEPWFTSVGIGGNFMDIIYLYANDPDKAKKYESNYQGHQVIIVKMDQPVAGPAY